MVILEPLMRFNAPLFGGVVPAIPERAAGFGACARELREVLACWPGSSEEIDNA